MHNFVRRNFPLPDQDAGLVDDAVAMTDAQTISRFSEHYSVLKKMARSRLRLHQPFTLLGTTELVHESYLKLNSAGALCPEDRTAYLNYVGNVMRSVIVDAARRRLALRRGANPNLLDIDDDALIEQIIGDDPANEIVQVHEALTVLNRNEPRLAQVLAFSYFAGMSELEIAECLNISDRTVRREISKAHLLLRAILSA